MTEAQRKAYENSLLSYLRKGNTLENQATTLVSKTVSAFRRETMGVIADASDIALRSGQIGPRLDDVVDKYRRILANDLATIAETTWVQGTEGTQAIFDRLADFDEIAFDTIPIVTGDDLLAALKDASGDRITGLTADVRNKITGHVRRIALGSTLEGGIEAIAKDLDGQRSIFKSVDARAEAIAQTETARIYAASSEAQIQEAMNADPNVVNQWLHAVSVLQPRPAHVALHLTTKGQGEKFSVNGNPATMPHDPSLPASEVVRCSCRVVPNYLIEGQPIPLPGLELVGPSDTLVYSVAA